MTTRRDFLKSGALLGGAVLGGQPVVARLFSKGPSTLDILVLGGTGFIGPHLVRLAIARGHRVTIFNRGRHDAELPTASRD